MPGPLPDPHARRPRVVGRWRTLPADGPEEDPPPWPLGAPPSKAVAARWDALWHRPQAALWHELRVPELVARYCLKAVDSEAPDATAALLNEVRQLEDRLCLTPVAMRRLGLEVAQPPEEPAPDNTAWIDDARRRLMSRPGNQPGA